MWSVAEQRAPGLSQRGMLSVRPVESRLETLRQVFSMLGTWCQLWAFSPFSGWWMSSQAGSGAFLKGLLVIQDRTAGSLSHTSGVPPPPEHRNSLWRRKTEPASSRLALTEKSHHATTPCSSLWEGVRKTDAPSPAQPERADGIGKP